MTRTRFIEAEDSKKLNFGKFLLVELGEEAFQVQSEITGGPLLTTMPVARRHGPILKGSVWMLDLQTQEGVLFHPSWSDEALVRRFMTHPVHVCILFLPVMRYFSANPSELWTGPQLVTIPVEKVPEQPGVLLDAMGKRVTKFAEWSARAPIAARLRNRVFEEDPHGQSVVEDEYKATQNPAPQW